MYNAAYRQCISENTAHYLLQQFPQRTAQWMDAFDTQVDALCDRWRLTLNGHEDTSRFGAILYGHSGIYGEVALKIIPWFSPRLMSEIACYRLLPYKEMCPLYDTDDTVGALLLKFLPTGRDDVTQVISREGLFSSLYAQRKPAPECEIPPLPRYEDVLAGVTQNAWRQTERLRNASISPLTTCITRAREAMAAFSGCERFIIHGDAHEYNMLVNGRDCMLIDPLGFIAPFAFEYARYLGTVTRLTPLSPDEFYALMTRLLPKEAEYDQALQAFAIDTTLRACNTFIEGNTFAEIRHSVNWAQRAWRVADALLQA